MEKQDIENFTEELKNLLDKYNLKMKSSIERNWIEDDCEYDYYSTIKLSNNGWIVAEIHDGLDVEYKMESE